MMVDGRNGRNPAPVDNGDKHPILKIGVSSILLLVQDCATIHRIAMENQHFQTGKSRINRPISIAMMVYQSVYHVYLVD